MELYEHAKPGLFAGKKILYVHGYASSGASGTVGRLRLLLPDATVVAPDVPVDPFEALKMLQEMCAHETPDLIIGTSMGGMYTEQLTGYDRICVNPALHLADTILKNNGLGKQEFHNVRQDSQTSFMMTKTLLEDYRSVSDGRFRQVEKDRVWGLFGTRDTLVDCFDEFAGKYPRAIRFDGEHQLNDHAILWSLLPVVRWIDDAQEGRSRRILLIDWDDVLRDTRNDLPLGEAFKVFHQLTEWYDTYIVSSADPNRPEEWGKAVEWTEKHLGVPAWNRVIAGNHPELLMGDYLISRRPCEAFMGTVLPFGEDPFRTWQDVLTFFSRLGGQ
ncbi:MAG: esterase [Bacteroidales bacterium]|nr:esterase [Bacteroidales bacterium]